MIGLSPSGGITFAAEGDWCVTVHFIKLNSM